MQDNRPNWRRAAACRGRVDLDFIEPSPDEAVECRTLCSSCSVREPCLREALRNREPWGIWGGADAIDRELVAMSEGLPAPRILPPHGTNTRYAKHRCPCDACRQAHRIHERRRRRRQEGRT
ncbi:WhiB family transcriptional regulator [Amycolatopsis acidicola]|uniref:WhiB family transcriptional regulator n=1 Tax=Amycolatopsis acidicola TaxID=2596893 RepID=UPI00140B75BF